MRGEGAGHCFWTDRKSLIWGSGRPRLPGNSLQELRREAPQLLDGFVWAAGAAQTPKINDPRRRPEFRNCNHMDCGHIRGPPVSFGGPLPKTHPLEKLIEKPDFASSKRPLPSGNPSNLGGGASPPTSVDGFPKMKGPFGPPKSGCEENVSIGWVAAKGPPTPWTAGKSPADRVAGNSSSRTWSRSGLRLGMWG